MLPFIMIKLYLKSVKEIISSNSVGWGDAEEFPSSYYYRETLDKIVIYIYTHAHTHLTERKGTHWIPETKQGFRGWAVSQG